MKTSRFICKHFFYLSAALVVLTSIGIVNDAHAYPWWYKGPWFIYENAYNMHVMFETDKEIHNDVKHRKIETTYKDPGCNEPVWEYFHEDIIISGQRDRRLWTVRAANLTPNCKYKIKFKYRHMCIDVWHWKWGEFHTAPDANVEHIGFFAFGDQKYISGTDEINDIAEGINETYYYNKNTFILHTGDIVYQGGYSFEDKDYWKNYFKIDGMRDLLSNMPMFTTPGNHDVDKGDGSNHINAANYHRYFPYGVTVYNPYYHRTYGPIQIYSLTSYPMETNNYCSDTNRNYRPHDLGGTGQWDWLKANLEAHDGDWRGWKVVIMHAPMYSPDDCNNQYDARTHLQPLFERYGVDLVLSGHEHYYARKTVNGITYLILGGAGAGLSLPDNSPCRSDPQCKGFDYVANKHHWAHFTIHGDEMHVSVFDDKKNLIEGFDVDKTPKADFEFTPAKGPFPLTVHFTDKSEGNRHKYAWYYGDGHTSDHQYGSDASISYTYTKEGVYSPELRIWSAWGVDTKVCYHCVKVGPRAEFDGAPLEGALPLTVQFEDKTEGAVSDWFWKFGDGNTSTEQNPTHTYNEHGKHTVNLTVSYNGVSDTMSKIDYVIVEPYAEFSYHTDAICPFSRFNPCKGDPFQPIFTCPPCPTGPPYTTRFYNKSAGDSLTYQWDFGDGHTSTEEKPVHTYSHIGARAKLTVTDGAGLTDYMAKYIRPGSGIPPEAIEIDIIPEDDSNIIQISSRGWLWPEIIPVAILSNASFDASGLDTDTISFGRTGNEASLVNCDKELWDVNGDGYRDLVCRFEARQTGFWIGDDEGILRGMTTDGRHMEGKDYVQVKEFRDPIHR